MKTSRGEARDSSVKIVIMLEAGWPGDPFLVGLDLFIFSTVFFPTSPRITAAEA